MTHDGDVLQHPSPELVGEHVGVLGTLSLRQLGEVRGPLSLGRRQRRRRRLVEPRAPVQVREHRGTGNLAGIDTGKERVGPEPVGAMVLVVALADRVEALDARALVARARQVQEAVAGPLVVHPQPAHRVVDRRIDLHRLLAWVLARELLIDLENALELALERLAGHVRQVQEHGHAAAHAEAHVDLSARHVARDQVPVLGIALLEEVPALVLGDAPRRAVVALPARHPHASALAARRLAHQPQLVRARNRGGVDLDELAVAVVGAVHVGGGRGRARVDDAVGAAAEQEPRPARGHDHGRCGERARAHAAEVQRHEPDAAAGVVAREPNELPALVLAHEPRGLMPAHLLVERVEELLAGRGAGERGAMVERPAEATELEQSLGRAVEHHAHAVEQVDDAGRRVAHALHRRLVRQEVAAATGVDEVDLGRVILAPHVHGAVDAALRAHRVRALDRHDREQVHGNPGLCELDRGHEPGEPAAHHGHARPRHQRAPARTTTGARSVPCGFCRKSARRPRKPNSAALSARRMSRSRTGSSFSSPCRSRSSTA